MKLPDISKGPPTDYGLMDSLESAAGVPKISPRYKEIEEIFKAEKALAKKEGRKPFYRNVRYHLMGGFDIDKFRAGVPGAFCGRKRPRPLPD